MAEVQFKVDKIDPITLYGVADQYLQLIEKNFQVQLIARGNILKIRGDEAVVEKVQSLLAELVFIANKNKNLTAHDVETLIHIVKTEPSNSVPRTVPEPLHGNRELQEIVLFTKSGYIKPRSVGQQEIAEAVQRNDLAVVIGPAGTGKTFMAVALAVAALKEKQVKKIVLARPAVEAGESLGFLPGDYKDKIDPYLRPLYDALEEMLPRDLIRKYLEQAVIEVIPLAFMRGRTLNNAFVILDEAQNASSMQMKMFLTRLGVNSKAIVNGDKTQIDLPDSSNSGLLEIESILRGVEGISFVYLDKKDVVRHRLVRNIIQAYDDFNQQKEN